MWLMYKTKKNMKAQSKWQLWISYLGEKKTATDHVGNIKEWDTGL